MNAPRRIISIKEALDRSPYSSRQSIYTKARDPDDPFPALVKVGENKSGLYEDEYDAWLNGLPRVSGMPKSKADASSL